MSLTASILKRIKDLIIKNEVRSISKASFLQQQTLQPLYPLQ